MYKKAANRFLHCKSIKSWYQWSWYRLTVLLVTFYPSKILYFPSNLLEHCLVDMEFTPGVMPLFTEMHSGWLLWCICTGDSSGQMRHPNANPQQHCFVPNFERSDVTFLLLLPPKTPRLHTMLAALSKTDFVIVVIMPVVFVTIVCVDNTRTITSTVENGRK